MISVTLLVICFIVGVLIGAVGIGGVLLVPALSFVADIAVHEAIPACMLAFLATGIAGVLIYARHGSIDWGRVLWLCLGATPAAFVGAILLPLIPATAVMLLITGLMIFAGIDALVKSYRQPMATAAAVVSPAKLVGIGCITGFGSAISGTGGPLILVPLAIYFGLPVLTAIGLSQAIQIPIAIFASAGNWLQGSLNFALAGTIAAALVVGTLGGAMAIHRVAAEPLRKIIAALLIVVGVGIAVRLSLG